MWTLPSTEQAEDTCLSFIGHGGSAFCTLANCHKKHQNLAFCNVVPGEAYVARAPDSAFVAPSIKLSFLTEQTIQSWFNTSNTLEEWNELFDWAKKEYEEASEDTISPKISEEDIKLRNETEKRFMDFKTPKKRKLEEDPHPISKPQFKKMLKDT